MYEQALCQEYEEVDYLQPVLAHLHVVFCNGRRLLARERLGKGSAGSLVQPYCILSCKIALKETHRGG